MQHTKQTKRLSRARRVPEVAELLIKTVRNAWFTLASYLQVSDRMIRKWVAEGPLRSYKLDGCRRFDPAGVDEFAAQFREAGGQHEPPPRRRAPAEADPLQADLPGRSTPVDCPLP